MGIACFAPNKPGPGHSTPTWLHRSVAVLNFVGSLWPWSLQHEIHGARRRYIILKRNGTDYLRDNLYLRLIPASASSFLDLRNIVACSRRHGHRHGYNGNKGENVRSLCWVSALSCTAMHEKSVIYPYLQGKNKHRRNAKR